MREIKRTSSNAPGRGRCSGEYATGCRTQTEPRKMDDHGPAGGFAGRTDREKGYMIDFFDLLMEQQEQM